MDKFYKIHDDMKKWNADEIEAAMRNAMIRANLNFDHWRRTNELLTLSTGQWADSKLNWNSKPADKITNGDMNITTNLSVYTTSAEQLFAGSGRRGRDLPKGGSIPMPINEMFVPAIKDRHLAELSPLFKGTILEDMHKFTQDYFGCEVRIRCQNRTVTGFGGSGLYWHNDNPVENRYHIPVWTNPGHVLIFSEKSFKWKEGFDPAEATEPMDFVGHYLPADGRVYELFTKHYMHSVGSVGVGWIQDKGLQTRCHLSFWKAKD
jgi:hypothetical protein